MQDVLLRAFERSDILHLHRWMNDSESLEMIGHAPLNFEEVERRVEKHRNAGDLLLAIEDSQSKLLGWVHLSKIEQEHGRAEIGILLAPEHRGKGIGQIGMNLMLFIAFNQLRLHRVYLTTRAINKRGISLYQKIGFSIEGHLKEHTFVGGEYHDTVVMGILSHEWSERSQISSKETSLCPR